VRSPRGRNGRGRLHHGRVLYLLERYAESAESLRAVAASTVDDELRYDAELFLGPLKRR
jgi:hypothetical protein